MGLDCLQAAYPTVFHNKRESMPRDRTLGEPEGLPPIRGQLPTASSRTGRAEVG